MTPKRPVAIDLFCGVGGMSLGFEQAGVEVLAAFDSEEFNVGSYKNNFQHTAAISVDLSKTSGDELRRLAKIGRRRVDVIFGGPPCQGFSVGGRRDLSDKRNQLVYDFARLVRQIRPKYFIMENVQGLMSAHSKPVLDSFLRRVKRSGYNVVEPIRVLNAADFGVPQRRKRTIVLGYIKGTLAPEYPEPTECVYASGKPVVADAISDLPAIDEYDELFEYDLYERSLPRAKSHYARLMRGLVTCYNDRSRTHNNPVGGLTGCLRTRHSKTTIRRFAKTSQGSSEPISRYFRLSWDDVAPTLRAGTGTDHGSHTAPRPIHPEMPRCITTREAARLHSFPDWFQFYGTRWHGFRQIGNAVPPFLARAIAAKIVEALDA